jgi:hypothetical protein
LNETGNCSSKGISMICSLKRTCFFLFWDCGSYPSSFCFSWYVRFCHSHTGLNDHYYYCHYYYYFFDYSNGFFLLNDFYLFVD